MKKSKKLEIKEHGIDFIVTDGKKKIVVESSLRGVAGLRCLSCPKSEKYCPHVTAIGEYLRDLRDAA